MGYINPYVYILFIILYPVKDDNRTLFLISSFVMGLILDFFGNSGGINATACLCVAYMRPIIINFSFGTIIEHQNIKIANTPLGQRLAYLSILILTHHLILFSLEIFSFTDILTILKKTLFSSVFTLFVCLLAIPFFARKRS
ncbi:rod shape-determining protein MreD [Leptobacterium sp. I13]|uniref:rod shape-determining protein MreD n=1 Tax=Leptobacterium meishanense TaxID=3128904 RepID=UPI0030EF7584